MPPADRSRAAGFTLIEILIVLAILGLMAGMVLMRGPQRSAAIDMRAASGTVASALRLARARAIATNRPVPVRFAPGAVRVAEETIRPLPPGIALTVAGTGASGPTVIFRPDGSSSGGVIALTSPTRSVRVVVNWLTGRVVLANGGPT